MIMALLCKSRVSPIVFGSWRALDCGIVEIAVKKTGEDAIFLFFLSPCRHYEADKSVEW